MVSCRPSENGVKKILLVAYKNKNHSFLLNTYYKLNLTTMDEKSKNEE